MANNLNEFFTLFLRFLKTFLAKFSFFYFSTLNTIMRIRDSFLDILKRQAKYKPTQKKKKQNYKNKKIYTLINIILIYAA